MRFTIGSTELASAVGFATKAIPARPAHPIFAGVRLTAEKDQLTVFGADNTTVVNSRAVVEADVLEPGDALVPGKLFADVVANIKGEVTIYRDETRLRVVAGKAKFALPLMPLSDYPAPMPDPAPGQVLGTIATLDLVRAVEQVAIAAASPNEPVPLLTCVQVEFTGSAITMAATDRYRLAARKVDWEATSTTTAASALVPAKALLDAVKGLAKDGDRIEVAIQGHGPVSFAGATRSTKIGTVEGEYPKWPALIPKAPTSSTVVNAATALQTLHRVAIVREQNEAVALSFGPELVKFRVGKLDAAGSEDEMSSEHAGDTVDINFNPVYLRDGLAACGAVGSDVTFSFIGSKRPAVLRPTDDENYTYLVMPVRGAA